MAVGNEATSNSQNDATSLAARKREVDESDLDPAAFLKSVRELSEKREREDAERFRRLEEEVQKGRQERAARRAGMFECFSLLTRPNTIYICAHCYWTLLGRTADFSLQVALTCPATQTRARTPTYARAPLTAKCLFRTCPIHLTRKTPTIHADQ